MVKKIVSCIIAISLTLCGSNTVNVKAEEPINVASECQWKSFSVCTREDGGVWAKALEDIRSDAHPNGYVEGIDFATKGWITTSNANSDFDFYVENSGWDAEYNKFTNELAGDNPWGMTATMDNIPVEPGMVYKVSFEIKSTLKGKYTNGEEITSKHILFKIFGKESGEIGQGTDNNNISSDGIISLDSNNAQYTTVSAKISIPYTYKEDTIGAKFALGAFLMTYPKEIGMKGEYKVRNFKIIKEGRLIPDYASAPENIPTRKVGNNQLEVSIEENEIQKLMNQKYNIYFDSVNVYTNVDAGKYVINNVREGYHKVKIEAILSDNISHTSNVEKAVYFMEKNIDNSWTGATESANDSWNIIMDSIGTEGALSKSIVKTYPVETDTDYKFSCKLFSLFNDKWVYVGIKDQNGMFLWGKWVYLIKGNVKEIDEVVKLSKAVYLNKATVVFGTGGEYGNCTNEEPIYAFLEPNQVLNDVSSISEAVIVCKNIKFEKNNGEQQTTEGITTTKNNGEQETTKQLVTEGTTTTKNNNIKTDNESKKNIKEVNIRKIKNIKKSIKVLWNKGTNITGYQIQYSDKRNFKKAKIKNISKSKTTRCVIKKLKYKKKYYVRIRTYLSEKGKKYYSNWYKTKWVKIK